ncbi:sulfotransferase domain protein [Rubidibacter lacunae KORDI 51-2]|uniref:Sulfotransferase domain protein n=1 Tax=Rubidibacter lacunae KORDI 51-2 TaxID=582515 RepID=U5DSU5_9CHRO|nr:sulfotransferase [Rubidibacter lacunae]ERN42760.1 sulfotransferase domain protein [Rubidibacter lacunae KORDI 51-2]
MKPRLLHPLMGSDVGTLVRVLARNGFVPIAQLPHVSLAMATAVLRSPFTLLERAIVAGRGSDMPPPVFIIGHWRSGTTFLYNFLSRSPEFAYVSPLATGLPWDFLTLASLLRPFLEKLLPSGRYIDRVKVQPDSPQEDEIALANMQTVSFYHGLYFPKHFRAQFNAGIFFEGCSPEAIETWQQVATLFFRKLYLQTGKRPLIKNPVYTARVAMLRSLFPGAKFVHIYRNPYVVFQSMRNFYRALFVQLALQPYGDVDIDEVVVQTYPRMLDALYSDVADLSPNEFIELRFEDFERDPLSHVEKIYAALAIGDFAAERSHFQTYLDAQETYRKNHYRFADEDNALVRQHWGRYCERWGYQPPGES